MKILIWIQLLLDLSSQGSAKDIFTLDSWSSCPSKILSRHWCENTFFSSTHTRIREQCPCPGSMSRHCSRPLTMMGTVLTLQCFSAKCEHSLRRVLEVPSVWMQHLDKSQDDFCSGGRNVSHQQPTTVLFRTTLNCKKSAIWLFMIRKYFCWTSNISFSVGPSKLSAS